MSGGGGSQTTVQQASIPQFVEDAAKANLARADYVSQLGYMPYYGPDVAALSPMQTQAMQSTGAGMQALGLAPQGFDPMAGMPQPQTFMGGLQGYSSGNLFDEALAQLQERRPAQYDAYTGMFIDPVTGDLGVGFTKHGSLASGSSAPIVSQMADYSYRDSGRSYSDGPQTGGQLRPSTGNFMRDLELFGRSVSPFHSTTPVIQSMVNEQLPAYSAPPLPTYSGSGRSESDGPQTGGSISDIANANQQSAYDAMGGFYS